MPSPMPPWTHKMAARIVNIDANNPDMKILEEASSLVLKGEAIVCPTDSGYALSADALNKEALRKVFAIKGRDFANPIHIAVSDLEEAEKYAEISDTARVLAKKFLPGALTLVLPRKQTVPSLLTAGLPTVGVRIPDNQIILTLARIARRPLTTTSANISGRDTPFSAQEAVDRLADAIEQVALVLDQGPLAPLGTSTLVDLSVTPPRILRQGQIKDEDIMRALPSIPD